MAPTYPRSTGAEMAAWIVDSVLNAFGSSTQGKETNTTEVPGQKKSSASSSHNNKRPAEKCIGDNFTSKKQKKEKIKVDEAAIEMHVKAIVALLQPRLADANPHRKFRTLHWDVIEHLYKAAGLDSANFKDFRFVSPLLSQLKKIYEYKKDEDIDGDVGDEQQYDYNGFSLCYYDKEKLKRYSEEELREKCERRSIAYGGLGKETMIKKILSHQITFGKR
ncbi:hypothetical protein BKA69DRAFT_371176 [Paraphysoderma sedebokerense]|nr:hypothetical protein BKA69DRAFT_371176 [Paraphysoderma sedebokerense]